MNNIKVRDREEKRRLKRLKKINERNNMLKEKREKELVKNRENLKIMELEKINRMNIKKIEDEKTLKRLDRIKLKNEKRELEKKIKIKKYIEQLELKKRNEQKVVVHPAKIKRKAENNKKYEKIKKKILQKRVLKLDKDKQEHNRVFYICSFGGCGFRPLSKYLCKFGEVHELTSRKPPTFLTKKNGDWFGHERVKNEDIKFYHVIYLYRNPLDAMNIQTFNSKHLKKIQMQNIHVTIKDIISLEKDYYHLDIFFNSYVKKHVSEKKKRNYDIISMKYESIFDKNNIDELNKVLNIDTNFYNLYPVEEKVNFDKYSKNESLIKAYKKLNNQIDSMPIINIS